MEKQQIVRVCELCGKREFEHLKPKDFFAETPAMVFNHHTGDTVKVSLHLEIEPWDVKYTDKKESKLQDIVDSYESHSEELPPMQMTPMGPMPMAMFTGGDELSPPEPTVCKTCFNGMVNIISQYGKFDKVGKV